MRDLNQLILEFKFDRNFKDQDFMFQAVMKVLIKLLIHGQIGKENF